MNSIKAGFENTELCFDKNTFAFRITSNGEIWETDKEYKPYFCFRDEKIYFENAEKIEHFEWNTGVGAGVRTVFTGFDNHEGLRNFSFQTVVWVEYATQDIYFELNPLVDADVLIGEFYWPGQLEFKEKDRNWYTVVNDRQGLMIPNDWPYEVGKMVFDGQMCSAGAFMPWFGQVRPKSAYIAIVLDPWDAGYQVDHPEASDYCHVAVRWLPSLGRLAYKRTIKFRFMQDADYNDLCKVYRQYAKEKALLVTLKEKAAKNPLVDKFIGSAIVHTGIKVHVTPDSAYYDKEHPENNDSVVTFAKREEQMRKLKEHGLEKVYLHLDGWGNPGYDNQHPDYLPACKEAGGWEGMKALSDSMEEMNYMFAIHDQYRDYYFDAKTYDPEFSMISPEGKKPEFARWYGGWQTYICASQSPLYVKRNFTELFKQGIHLEGTYLDVFTCNEADECAHPWHKMTRKECIEYRKNCFDFLNANDILPSSEEATDWAVPSLVTAHYGPYTYMLEENGDKLGIPVPLYNLVYHDCIVLPWYMDSDKPGGDYMLHALLNGGAAYLDCELDGEELEKEIKRYKTVAKLQEKVAYCEMVHHEFLDGNYKKQRAIYSDKTEVTIDLENGTYEIQYA